MFDALDSDRDGVVGREELREGLGQMAAALGIAVDAEDGQSFKNAERRAEAEPEPAAGAATIPPRDAGAGAGATPKKAGGIGWFLPTKADEENLSFTAGFSSSVAMIIATEIGDKTFFIAAVLSMRNARSAVFGGAILGLIIMTILSTMMGLVLPTFLPRKYTHIIGGLLFLYFGVKLVLESRSMEDKVSDELEEVEEELLHTRKKDEAESAGDDQDPEKGKVRMGTVTNRGKANSSAPSSNNGGVSFRKAASDVSTSSTGMSSAVRYSDSSWKRVFTQALTLTFVAEWGDRSQIATIALAAAKDPLGVTLGGCFGHSICTGMAVIGGRMLASRISEKTVTFWGGLAFNIFGLHSLFFET